jgi:putative ABC transport system substrate-binding protein
MNRRDFITLLGGAAAWPLTARAQQPAPVIGFLSGGSPESFPQRLAAFRKGLSETGFVEGRNLDVEFRWAETQPDRLPALAADLVRRRVAVIVAHGDLAAFAAKAATTSIAIVVLTGTDPVRTGLVASLNRPGGNITAATWSGVDLVPKRLTLLHEIVPKAAVIALLVDETNADALSQLAEVQEGARAVGLRLVVLNARSADDIDTAFAILVQQRVGALVVGAGGLFGNQRDRIIALAARHAIPAIYSQREFTEAGGLISYGNSTTEAARRVGFYTGLMLKGAKPADLPVDRATKFELVINFKTVKALGLTVPLTLQASADEVIE